MIQLVNQEKNCISQFPFLAVQSQEGLSPAHGLLGFGPSNNNRDSLLLSLKWYGKIDRALIAFDLRDAAEKEQSSATIGDVDLSNVVDGKLHDLAVVNNTWWAVDFENMKYGNENLMKEAPKDDNRAIGIVDTGTSFVALPPQIYDNFLKSIEKNMDEKKFPEMF